MTVASETRKSPTYVGNGVTTSFPFGFKVFDKADLRVVLTVIATGVDADLVLDSDYSVALNADQNANPGGSITYPLVGSAMDTLHSLIIVSDVDALQEADIANLGGFYPEVIEDALDREMIVVQQLQEQADRSVRVPVTVTGVDTETPAPAPLSIFGWDITGTRLINYIIQAGTSLVDLATSAGASFIGFIQTFVGSVLRTVQDKLRETVSPEDFGAIGDGTLHLLSERYSTLAAAQAVYPFVTALTQAIDWAAWQAAVNACSRGFEVAGTERSVPAIKWGAGRTYNIGADPIIPPNYVTAIWGQGMQNSYMHFSGPACFKSPVSTYFCPSWRDFSIVGPNTSGYGIDLSPTTGEVFLANLERLNITSGSDCIYAPRFFSGVFDSINGNSFNGHTFRVACGPSVSWRNTYAASCGAGKAGYRLAGCIRMYSCNGVNSADYWGVFGSNTGGTGGTGAWTADFAGDDYPDVELHGCNVEFYTKGGVWIVQAPQNAKMNGGKIDRNAKATAYEFDVRVSANPFAVGGPGFVLDGVRPFLGAGVPTLAHFYSDASAPFMELNGDFWTAVGVTTYRTNGPLDYPIVRQSLFNDIFQGEAVRFNALAPRRLSVELMRFKELTLADGTTVADVTGYTQIKTANTANTNLTTANFTTTNGADLDFSRNGFLIISVNDNFTTIIQSQGGVNGFWMRDKCKYKAARGDMFVFVFSPLFNGISSGWVEVGRSTRYSPEVTDIVKLFEDFTGRTINAGIWQGRVGSDGACVAPAILANQSRGVARLTTGAGAGADMATNGSQLDSALNWQGNTQNTFPSLFCEFRIALSAITNVAVFIGLTDQVAALEMPATLGAGDALTTNFSDGVGVLFDTAADTDNWWLVGVKADVDAAKQNSGVAPVAATFEVWRIEVNGNGGSATFYRNGVVVGVSMANALTTSVPLTPVVACFSRAAASRNIDVDYILVQEPRA